VKRPLYIALVLTTGCYEVQGSACGTSGPSPILNIVQVTPTPTPTPKPTPTQTGTPNPCSFKTLKVDFLDGLPFTVKDTRKLLDLTPYDALGNKISDGCNTIRTPEWAVGDTDFCEVIGGGFNPQLLARSVTIEKCSVIATLRDEFQNVTIVSNTFHPEIR
jgi:hypothetical protein